MIHTSDGEVFDSEFDYTHSFLSNSVPPQAPGKPADAFNLNLGTKVPESFNTLLTTAEEKNFQTWKQQNAPNDSGSDYDLRGAFLRGLSPAENGHWPDTFKKPNHPTFSDQSIYAPYGNPGKWEGDTYIPGPGSDSVEPANTPESGTGAAAAETGAGLASMFLVPSHGREWNKELKEYVNTPLRYGQAGEYNMVDAETGKVRGSAKLNYDPRDRSVHIGMVRAEPERAEGTYVPGHGRDFVRTTEISDIARRANWMSQTIGLKEIKSLLPEVKRVFPDAESIQGFRISGGREAARLEAAKSAGGGVSGEAAAQRLESKYGKAVVKLPELPEPPVYKPGFSLRAGGGSIAPSVIRELEGGNLPGHLQIRE